MSKKGLKIKQANTEKGQKSDLIYKAGRISKKKQKIRIILSFNKKIVKKRQVIHMGKGNKTIYYCKYKKLTIANKKLKGQK